jgi:predicted DCC family thiol-disulfide oxidoreductase YuxK
VNDATNRIRPAHPVLLYDDHCKFCRAGAALVDVWDRDDRLDFLGLSDPLALQLLAPMSEAERLESIHVVQPDGTITSAGAALRHTLAELPVASLVSRAAAVAAPIAAGIDACFGGLSAIRGSLAPVVPERDPIRRWRGEADEPLRS